MIRIDRGTFVDTAHEDIRTFVVSTFIDAPDKMTDFVPWAVKTNKHNGAPGIELSALCKLYDELSKKLKYAKPYLRRSNAEIMLFTDEALQDGCVKMCDIHPAQSTVQDVAYFVSEYNMTYEAISSFNIILRPV